MSDSARVRHVGVLEELRGSLAEFADLATLALEGVDADLRRTREWLERQERHWQATIRKCEDTVNAAKQELARRRLMKAGDRPLDCSEQEEQLHRARRRLEFAEEKQEVTRNWLRQWDTEMIDYEGPTRQLKNFLATDLVRAGALLRDKVQSLENYLAVTPNSSISPRGREAGIPQAPVPLTPDPSPPEYRGRGAYGTDSQPQLRENPEIGRRKTGKLTVRLASERRLFGKGPSRSMRT